MKEERLIQWFNVIRELATDAMNDYHSTDARKIHRLSECFWESQIKSKRALIDLVASMPREVSQGDTYIFGGWYGLLAQMLVDLGLSSHVYSIDIDYDCSHLGKKLSGGDSRIQFLTSDMATFGRNEYFVMPSRASLIINTSTEHVSQETYDAWLENVPVNVPIILQGNNFFDCKEHVRCSANMDHFVDQCHLDTVCEKQTINCGTFDRYMIMGYKHA